MSAAENVAVEDFDFFGADKKVELMPDFMIDIETMGNRPTAPIISVGAVAFNLARMTIGERFYANIDLASSIANGAVPDPSTIMWWMAQSDEARRRVSTGKKTHVDVFMGQFAEWLDANCVPVKQRKVWACGTDFDVTILGEHYKRAARDLPWMFWNSRDQRTIRELWKDVADGVMRAGTHHDAADDAIHQVEQLFAIRRHLASRGKP